MLLRTNKSHGQALVEFALILTVLLMLIFLVIESARILQGWVTVQNAARAGARYAITGQNESPCPTNSLLKFVDRCDDFRVASVIAATHQGLAGLPLNENPNSDPFGSPPDDNSYYIEVFGGFVDSSGAQLRPDYAGMPGQPVIVRVVYNVPVITPFFRPIISAVPVFGQVVMNNESFGSLGNPTQGLGLPPDLDTVPTVGASPTPTPTPSNTPSPSPGPSLTPSITPSASPSSTPVSCGAFIESVPIAGQNYLWVSGEVGATVTIVNLTTGQTLGTDVFQAVNNRLCPGFADFDDVPLNPALVAGHVIAAIPSAGQPATAIVLVGTPTPTVSPTSSPIPTSTITPTPTPSATATPSNPYIVLIQNCSVGPDAQFNVIGANWPNTEAVGIFWQGSPQSIVPAGHGGAFSVPLVKNNLVVGPPDNPTLYEVRAQSNTWTATAFFRVPCPNPIIPTLAATFTPTPAPADLIVVGPPQLISTRPLVAYQPISVRVVISNTGDVDVSSQFFVDVFFDPIGPITPTIAITNSVGYMGVSNLAGRTSRVITITAPLGFANEPDPHLAYSMVDSLLQVSESDETNNVSELLVVRDVTPAPTPTPTATPSFGTDNISGQALSYIFQWLPQPRAIIRLVNESNGVTVRSTQSLRNGSFIFANVPTGTYTIIACALVDNRTYAGIRTGVDSTDPIASISADVLMRDDFPCP